MKTKTLPIISVIATTIFAFLFALEKIYNYDIWFHLKSGEWVLQNHKILYQDFFSFSTYGAPWANTGWLGGVLFALIENNFGLNSLLIFKASVIGLAFGSACLFLIIKGVNPYIATILICYSVLIARFRFLLRPLIFMFPFVVSLFWILSEPLDRKKKIASILPLITICWGNLHGSVLLAPVFTTFLLAESGFKWIVNIYKNKAAPFPKLELTLTFAVILSIFINPYGISSIQWILKVIFLEDLVKNTLEINEFKPLKWGEYNLFWILLITSGASFLINFRNIRLFYLLTYIGTAWLSINSVRYIGITSLVQVLILGINIKTFKIEKISTFYNASRLQHLIFPIILLLTAFFIFKQTFKPSKVYQWGMGINESRYPLKATEYLKSIQFTGNIFNSWDVGGFIQWNLPGTKTFIDGRGLTEQLELYQRISSGSFTDFEKYLLDNNVNGALLNKDSKNFIAFLGRSSRYNLHYFDDRYLVYLSQEFSERLDQFPKTIKFKYIKPQELSYNYLLPYINTPIENDITKELYKALELYPENFSLLLQIGFFTDMQNNPEAALFYLKALKRNPGFALSHFNLGKIGAHSAIKHKEWATAIEIIKVVIENGFDNAETYFLYGSAYYKLNQLDLGEKYLKTSIKLDTEQISPKLNLGFLYVDKKEFEQAEELFSEILKSIPNHEAALFGKALVYQKLNKKEAGTAWRELLNKHPETKYASQALKYLRNIQK